MKFDLPGVDCSAWPMLDTSDVQSMIDEVRVWYHAISLQGIDTPGVYDMRPYVERYHMPDLEGLEVLDVGASNGYFSFLFESLGAKVTSVDLPSYPEHDYPKWVLERELSRRGKEELSLIDWDELHGGYLVAAHVLGSKNERVLTRIYDMPDVLEPKFDIAFCSNVLVHLRDPVGAMEAIRAVLKPGGRTVIATPVLREEYGEASAANLIGFVDGPAWWVPAISTFRRWHEVIGLKDVEIVDEFDTQRAGGDRGVDYTAVIHATR